MDELYIGFAKADQEKELLRFLDKVFTRLSVRLVPYFLPLLPKLYKHEYNPCENNLIISDKNEIRAALGLYMRTYVCGKEKLTCAGVGNVAVGKKFRSRGYMKQLMKLAFETAKKRGTDFIVLGGKRHRYNYFGYERAGALNEYKVNKTNLRHCLGEIDSTGWSVHRLRNDDLNYLEEIHKLRSSVPIYVETEPEALFDTLRSWFAHPYVLLKNGSFVGYFILRRSSVEELRLLDCNELSEAVNVIFQEFWRGELKFIFSPAEDLQNRYFRGLCENADSKAVENYLILNYGRVLDVIMREKNSRTPLLEGRLVVGIDGLAGKEILEISVKDNEVAVTECGELPEIELSHLEATRVFFDPLCPDRDALPAIIRAWFPLPLFFAAADMV